MAQEQRAAQIEKPIISWRQRIIDAQAIVTRPWRHYRAAVFQGYLIGAIIGFLILATLAHTIAYFTFDVTITRSLQLINAPFFESLMVLISWFGFAPQASLVLAIPVLFLYLTGLRWEAVMALATGVGIGVIGGTIKLLVIRPRPSADLVDVFARIPDYSFPSGHVLFYTAFFGFLLFLTFTLLKHSWVRIVMGIVLFAFVALVGVSRIYLGQHWMSDVLGAYLLGSLWLTLMVSIYRWGKPRYFVHQPIAREAGKDRPK